MTASTEARQQDAVVDAHAHFFPRAFLEALSRLGGDAVSLTLHEGTYHLTFEGKAFAQLTPVFHDPEERIRSMDANGVTTQVVSVGPPMVFWAPGRDGLELARIYNDGLAELVADHPSRFVAAAAVPLQDPALAAEEAERAVEQLGHRMVLVGTNIDGTPLDHPSLEEFYAAIDGLSVPLFVHPINPSWRECGTNYRLDLAVAFPTETTLAASRVLLSGLLDRWPNLRFLWSHLGGSLPFLFDRVDAVTRTFPGAERPAERPIEEYLPRFWFDTAVFSERCLHWGVEFAGTERLVFGTDAPYFGDPTRQVLECVRSVDGLSARMRDGILHHNVVELLGLSGS